MAIYKDEDFFINLDFAEKYSTESANKGIELFGMNEEFGIDERLDVDCLFEFTEPYSFVGLRSPTNNPLKIFFVAEVIRKEIATTCMFDQHGHQILTGEKYLVINYLNLKNDKVKNE